MSLNRDPRALIEHVNELRVTAVSSSSFHRGRALTYQQPAFLSLYFCPSMWTYTPRPWVEWKLEDALGVLTSSSSYTSIRRRTITYVGSISTTAP